jgi:hypothetical protein
MSSAQMQSDSIDVRGGDMIHLVRDVLDKMMVDRRHDPMGRVDGIVLKVPESGAPRVTCIESGIVVAGSRVSRRIGRWARWAARRWGLSRGRPVRIGWDDVVRVGVEAKLDLDAEKTRALAWEHWLLGHIVRYVPSLKKAAGDDGSASLGQPAKPQAVGQKVRGRRIRLQRLLGRKVVDKDGRAGVRDGVCVVESFELGRQGLLERLSIGDVSLAMVRVLGARRGAKASGHRVPWQQLDLSDAEHPRLRCAVTELKSAGA